MGYSFYQLFSYFVIYSIIGWVLETLLVSIQEGRFVNRGFMNGFYCPIYGIGMCGVILLFSPYKDNIFILYIGGVILTSILEYFTSWAMEMLFHARWWDYSQFKFNLNGRICLGISLSWGILIVFFIRFVHPAVDSLINHIPQRQGTIVAYLLLLFVSADLIYSIYGAFKFSDKLKSLTDMRRELAFLLEQSGSYFDDMRTRIMDEGFFKLTGKLSASIKSVLVVKGVTSLPRLNDSLENLMEKYRRRAGSVEKNEKRFLKAFPNMLTGKAVHIISDIREIVLHKTKKP
jgi:uncharacterized membrane protein